MKADRISRKAAAAVLSLTLVASMSAVLATATDYATSPDYNQPRESTYSSGSDSSSSGGGSIASSTGGGASSGGGSSTAGNNANTASNNNANTASNNNASQGDSHEDAPAASILTAATVEAAINSGNTTVGLAEDNNGNVTLMEDTLAAIVESGVEVTIEVTPSSKNEIAYSVGIDPDMIPDDYSGSINIGMNISRGNHSANGVRVPVRSVVVQPTASGDLGVTLQVTIPKKEFKNMKASKVRPYIITGTGKNKKVELMPKDAYKINNDGSITIYVDNGDAAIVLSDKNIAKAARKHGTAK